MANATIGREREVFIDFVLKNIIAPPFRVGSGEAVDRDDQSTGQLDIAIEYSNSLSFPLPIGTSERLYLAESLCAIIEVKSNLATQWNEVERKASMISKLVRNPGAVGFVGRPPPKRIPVFVVGFQGWESSAILRNHLGSCNSGDNEIISGILQIDPAVYITSTRFPDHAFEGDRALFGFLLSLEELMSSMIASKPAFKPYVE